MVDEELAYEEEERRAALAVDSIGAEARQENACGARRFLAAYRRGCDTLVDAMSALRKAERLWIHALQPSDGGEMS